MRAPEKRRPIYLDLQKDPYFAKWYPIWVAHDTINWETVRRHFKRESRCISTIPPSSTPVIVVGSGYSLDRAIPYLKKWKGEIIAGNSNVFTLLANGIVPTYVCAYDAHPTLAKLLTDYREWPKSVTLLTHPHIHPKLLHKWKNPVRYFRRRWRGLEYFEWILELRYGSMVLDNGGIQIGMRFRGCVLNTQIQCAHIMGTPGRPIYMIGADFGWLDNSKNRCTTCIPRADGKTFSSTKSAPIIQNEKGLPALTVGRDGYEFAGDMDMFRKHMYEMYLSAEGHDYNPQKGRYGPMTLIDCSNMALVELQQENIEEVVEKQGLTIERRDVGTAVRGYLRWHAGILAERYEDLQRRDNADFDIGDTDGVADDDDGVVGGDGGGDTGRAPGDSAGD